MADTINIDEIAEVISKSLSEYSEELGKKVDKIVVKTGREIAEELENTSPKDKGEYAKSWKVTVTSKATGNKSIVIHNKKYRLTHLLENGHANRNGGRTKAIPHIKPVEEKYVNEFIKRVEEACSEA